ncbi:MAG: helix-turn-helix domain-containing protein [Janthinobacterium lividum]
METALKEPETTLKEPETTPRKLRKTKVKSPVMVLVGSRLRQRREIIHWNQRDVALAIGVSEDTYGDWERGLNVMPCIYLPALSNALRCPIGEFFGESAEIGQSFDQERVLQAVVRSYQPEKPG